MAYQQGSYDLTSGTVDYTIPFAPAFGAIPDVVIATVSNTSADPVKLLIGANVVAKSTGDFTIRLDGTPNSNNYDLEWIAGDAELIFQSITLAGRKISEVSQLSGVPANGDYFPLVRAGAMLETVRVPIQTLHDMFPSTVAAPSAATSTGSTGEVAFDDDYFYFHTGTVWNRIPRSGQSDWTIDAAAQEVPFIEGSEVLTASVQTVAVTYATPFTGSPVPQVRWTLEYTGGGTPHLISGIITARSLTGFTLVLSSPPPDGNYSLYYTARQV